MGGGGGKCRAHHTAAKGPLSEQQRKREKLRNVERNPRNGEGNVERNGEEDEQRKQSGVMARYGKVQKAQRHSTALDGSQAIQWETSKQQTERQAGAAEGPGHDEAWAWHGDMGMGMMRRGECGRLVD